MILSKDINKFLKKILNKRIEKTSLKYLIEALNEIYPNRWDLQLNNGYTNDRDINNDFNNYESLVDHILDEGSLGYQLIIHYPEIIITNSKLNHKITDLYVQIPIKDSFRNKNISFRHIMGTRASKTIDEIKSNYQHSHLMRCDYYSNFSDFCLGSGPIKRVVGKELNEYTKEDYSFFLLLLNNYVKWESISGVPYIRMDSIRDMEPASVNTSYAQSVINQAKFNNLNFKITDSSIEVISDNNIEQQIFEYLNSLGAESYLCYKASDGRYVTKSKQNFENEYKHFEGKVMNFTFKGEQVKFKITNTENIINYEYNAPNPNLTKEVCKQLSKQITKKHITNSRVIKKDRVEDTQESISSDQVSV